MNREKETIIEEMERLKKQNIRLQALLVILSILGVASYTYIILKIIVALMKII